MSVEKDKQRIDMDDIREVFYEALEQGGSEPTREMLDLGKQLRKVYDDYLNETDFYYFAWGYQLGLKHGKGRTKNQL